MIQFFLFIDHILIDWWGGIINFTHAHLPPYTCSPCTKSGSLFLSRSILNPFLFRLENFAKKWEIKTWEFRWKICYYERRFFRTMCDFHCQWHEAITHDIKEMTKISIGHWPSNPVLFIYQTLRFYSNVYITNYVYWIKI